MNARAMITGVAAIFAFVTCVSVSGAAASPREDPKPPPSTGNYFPDKGIPGSLMLAINKFEDSADWAQFSDLSWSESDRLISVHYVGSALGLEGTLEGDLPSGSFNLVRDPYSHKQLASAAQEIAALAQSAKFPLASVGPSPANDAIAVEFVSSDSQPLADNALTAFKSIAATATAFPLTWTSIATQPATMSRLLDNAPFWGGNRMNNGKSQCTSGFKVENGSSTAMLTADHCGGDGDRWYASSGATTGNFEGTMSSGNSGGSDFRKLTGSTYSARVWVAENGGDNQAVKGKFNAIKGDSVCADGSESGQRCNLEITNDDYVMCVYAHGCYNNEVRFLNRAGNGVIQEGDSGGPMLKGATGGALVGGVITGYYPTSQASSCLNGSSGPCYYEGFYAAVRAFLNNNPGWKVSTS